MMFRRLKEIALADMLAIRWTLAWACIAMGVGFLISGTDNENYVLLNNIFPKELWGIGFIALGLFSVFLCFITANILLVSISTICAVWLWSYIFFSFTLFDPTPIKSTEWLLAIPIIIELWVFVNMSAHKFKPREFDKHFANSLEVMITGIHNQEWLS